MDDIAKQVPSYQLDQDILDARGINMTVEEVAGLPTCKYSERVQSLNLKDDDLAFLKGLRRRIKNRLASQNSRRRSMEHLRRLTRELRVVRACRDDALSERRSLLETRAEIRKSFTVLRNHVLQTLKDRSDPTEVLDLEPVQYLPEHTIPKLNKEKINQNEKIFEHSHNKNVYDCHPEDKIITIGRHSHDTRNFDCHPNDKKVFDCHPHDNKILDCHPEDEKIFDCHPEDKNIFDCHPENKKIFDCHPHDKKIFDCHPHDKKIFDCYPRDKKIFDCHPQDKRNILECLSQERKNVFECRIEKLVQQSVNHMYKEKEKRVCAKTVFIDIDRDSKSEMEGVLNLCVKEKRRSHGRKQLAPKRIAYFDDNDDGVLDLKIKKENQ